MSPRPDTDRLSLHSILRSAAGLSGSYNAGMSEHAFQRWLMATLETVMTAAIVVGFLAAGKWLMGIGLCAAVALIRISRWHRSRKVGCPMTAPKRRWFRWKLP